MNLSEIVLGLYLTFLGGGLAALFWVRMNRIEERLVRVETTMATKDELSALRQETHSEFAEMRKDFAIMRSDLTHVALAVGARPRASEN